MATQKTLTLSLQVRILLSQKNPAPECGIFVSSLPAPCFAAPAKRGGNHYVRNSKWELKTKNEGLRADLFGKYGDKRAEGGVFAVFTV